MSCAMQMNKLSPITANEWKTIFPDFTTFTGSCLFIKKLLAVSLSTVTYIRGVFPERAYGERKFCGIKLKVLSEDSGIESVNKFINLVGNCYEAVDNKYLQQLSIGICTDPENRDQVLESYNMTFRYREDRFSVANIAGSKQLNEKDPTVEATMWLLNSILAMSDLLDPLPKEVFITMKLLYNDDITPSNYEPVGFEPSNLEKFTYPPQAVKLEIGKVATDLHGYKMYLKTVLSKEPLSQYFEEAVMADSQRSGYMTDFEQSGSFMSTSQEQVKTRKVVKSGAVEVSPVVREDEEEIKCICSCKQGGGTDVFACSICGVKQHSICYGILEQDETESGLYCIHCVSEAPTKSCQTDLIYLYEGDEQLNLSAFRRALVFCESQKRVTVLQLEKGLICKKQLAKDLIERLEFEGFIRKSGNKYIVNGNKIAYSGYQEYFPRKRGTEKTGRSQTASRSITQRRSGRYKIKNNVSPSDTVGSDEENTGGMQRRTRSQTLTPSQRQSKTTPASEGSPSDDPVLSEEDHDHDLAVEEGVLKLNLKETPPSERQRSNSRRRSLKELTGNKENEIISRPGSKRRCLNAKKVIELGK